MSTQGDKLKEDDIQENPLHSLKSSANKNVFAESTIKTILKENKIEF